MMSPQMMEKIRARMFPDAASRRAFIERWKAKNEQLNKQLEAQRMTPEVLAKRCTL